MISWLRKIIAVFHPASQKVVDLAWSQTGNVRVPVPDFGAETLVIRFTTPATADTAAIQVSQLPGAPQVFRAATLTLGGTVLAEQLSQSPVFRLSVGGDSRLGLTALQPNTTYCINVVNRDSYNGPCNCNGNCGVNIDFTN